MQTRPFFKNIITSVRTLFRRPDQHLSATAKPDSNPAVRQKKSSGGKGWIYVARRKLKAGLISSPASTNPKFMSRAARVRAGLQGNYPTWHKSLRMSKIVGMTPNEYWNYFGREVATLQ